jgi:hypothetical protein
MPVTDTMDPYQAASASDPLDAPLSELLLLAAALGMNEYVQLMGAALAGCDLMARALAGEDVGDTNECIRWIHQHEKGRLDAERERVRQSGQVSAMPTAQGGARSGIPIPETLGISEALVVGVANLVIDTLRKPEPIRDPRMALLVAMLVRGRLLGTACVVVGLTPLAAGAQGTAEQIAVVNRAERIASGDEASALRLTERVKTVLHAVGQECMNVSGP